MVGEPGEPHLHRVEGKPLRSPWSSDRALFLRGATTSGLGQWALGTRGKPWARRGELQRRRRYVRLQPSGFGGGWCHSGPWLLGGAGGRAAASSSGCFEARGVAFCRGVRNSEEEGAWTLVHERQQCYCRIHRGGASDRGVKCEKKNKMVAKRNLSSTCESDLRVCGRGLVFYFPPKIHSVA